MPLPLQQQMNLDALFDAILMELSVNHPGITEAKEAELKRLLVAIMADEEGWRHDPEQMARRFREAMDDA